MFCPGIEGFQAYGATRQCSVVFWTKFALQRFDQSRFFRRAAIAIRNVIRGVAHQTRAFTSRPRAHSEEFVAKQAEAGETFHRWIDPTVQRDVRRASIAGVAFAVVM